MSILAERVGGRGGLGRIEFDGCHGSVNCEQVSGPSPIKEVFIRGGDLKFYKLGGLEVGPSLAVSFSCSFFVPELILS